MHAFLRKGISGAAPASGVLVRKSGLLPGWLVLVAVLVVGFGGVSSAYGQCDCTDTATTGVPEVECNALLALYASTNGAGWSDNTNWNTAGTAVSSWFGVVVTGGQVERLHLGPNQLTGSISAQLGNLTNLSSLSLSLNKLTGNIPTELGNLTNLTGLLLDSNQLSGEIPATITYLTALDTFSTNFGYNMLTATDPNVTSFLDIKDPDWADTQTIPPENLTTIDITGNSIKLTWTPIPYTADGGYYRIYYATTSGGPYTAAGTTTDKAASEYTVTGLSSDTIYYFVIETFTPAHGNNQNDLTSPPSTEVFARTSLSPGNINKDSAVDLIDAILVLKILAGIDISGTEIDLNSDVDRNSQIGIENAIYILREVAGLNATVEGAFSQNAAGVAKNSAVTDTEVFTMDLDSQI